VALLRAAGPPQIAEPALQGDDEVPAEAREVYALLAASGRAIRHHCEGRHQRVDLERILEAQQGADGVYEADYWRCTLQTQRTGLGR